MRAALRTRLAAAVLAGAGSALSSGCAVLRAEPRFDLDVPRTAPALWSRAAVSPEVRVRLTEARRLVALGRRADAFAAARQLAEDAPDFVEAERLVQDLTLFSQADVWLRERCAARLATRPDDADSWYFAARVEPDPAQQARWFERALSIDPVHPYATLGRAVALDRAGRRAEAVHEAWRAAAAAPELSLPWTFLGASLLSRGDGDRAARFFREAALRDPLDARPWAALAAAADEAGRSDAAAAASVEALRRAPGDPGVCMSAARLLERHGSPLHLEEALRAADSVRTEAGFPAVVEFLRGRVLTALGRHDDAVEALEAAARGGLLSGDTAGPLRRARVAAGRILDAVDGGLAYAALAGEAGEVSGAWDEVRAARDAFAATAGPAERVRLARAMSSVGWIDEARTVASPAARDGDPDAAALCAELAGFRAFLDDVAAWSRDARRRSRAGDDDDADDAMTVVRNASTARLGLDLTEGASERSYPLLGSFACSTEGAGAFRDVPSRFGMVLVVGGRSGRAADVVAGRLVALRRGAEVRVLDRTVRIDEHVIDAEGLPEGVNGLRTGLAGITLDDVVLVQIDSVLRTPRPADAGFPLVERAAASRGELLALDTPSEVSRRIEESLPAGRRREELLLDAVRRHERVHAMDAADMLPILAHPLRNLAFALSHGFGAESMEQTLEGRAALLSIVDADDPRAALAALVSFLPAREGDAPHAAGYRRMTEAFLLEIARDPSSFPSVRAGANLLQQLDRLGPDEVREAARRAVDREF